MSDEVTVEKMDCTSCIYGCLQSHAYFRGQAFQPDWHLGPKSFDYCRQA